MNWMTWSSVRANVERKIPRLTAPSARSSTTRYARTGLPTTWMPEAERERRQRPDRRHLDRAQRPGQQQRDLDRGEQPEPDRVAGDDLAPGDGRRHQPLQRPAGPLAQEADAGQDVDEEVDEERDDGRGVRVHRIVRPPVPKIVSCAVAGSVAPVAFAAAPTTACWTSRSWAPSAAGSRPSVMNTQRPAAREIGREHDRDARRSRPGARCRRRPRRARRSRACRRPRARS